MEGFLEIIELGVCQIVRPCKPGAQRWYTVKYE